MRTSGRKGVFASLFEVGAPEALVVGVVALMVFGPKGLAEETGWLPRHIVAQDEDKNILGVIPLYLKSHSYRYSNLSKAFEAAKHESLEWKRKYEDEVANLKARSSAAEAILAAAREQTLSAQEEADEWKCRYVVSVKEAKSKQTQHCEYVLPAEFEGTLAEKVRIETSCLF